MSELTDLGQKDADIEAIAKRALEEVEAWIGRIAKTYRPQKICTIEEIANVALFLLSHNSSYINGQFIVVDGGRSVADVHEF